MIARVRVRSAEMIARVRVRSAELVMMDRVGGGTDIRGNGFPVSPSFVIGGAN